MMVYRAALSVVNHPLPTAGYQLAGSWGDYVARRILHLVKIRGNSHTFRVYHYGIEPLTI